MNLLESRKINLISGYCWRLASDELVRKEKLRSVVKKVL